MKMSSIDPSDAVINDSELIDIQHLSDAVLSTSQNLTELFVKFFVNLLVCWTLVHCFYYRKSHRQDYYFTFLTFSSAMLLLLYMMGNVEVGVGLTLGLFAIFGIIRYRTETIPIHEMTYLFVIIALAAVNGLAPVFQLTNVESANPSYELSTGSILIMVISNLLAICLIGILETERLVHPTASKLILYDKIDLITPERRSELIRDIKQRTGIEATHVEIGHIDLLKDAAFIKIYYSPQKGETNTIADITKLKQPA